jgi:arylsulfate sulfotransferase
LHIRSFAVSASCAVLFLLTGCGSGSSVSTSVSGTANPQVAAYSVTLPKPGNVTVDFGPDTSYGFSTSAQHTPASGLTATILVAGMKANTTYHMQAKVVYDDDSSTENADQTFTTGALPKAIPQFTVTPTSGLTPQPGVELVDPLSFPYTIPFATDLQGNIVWTYTPPETQISGETIYPVKLLSNGHFMCLIGTSTSNSALSPGIRCASFPLPI